MDSTDQNQKENRQQETEKKENPEDQKQENNQAAETNEDEQKTTNRKKETLYRMNDNWLLKPLKEETNDQVVLLTIDDAPKEYAIEMAETLKVLDAPAIFFVNGHFLETEKQKNVLKKIHEMGFAIGNHTYNHTRLTEVDSKTQKQEIVKLNDVIKQITGETPKFFRAPHGANTDHVKKLVADKGMLLMNWTYGYDYFKPYMDAEKLTEAMITGKGPEAGVDYSLLQPGANLLMHDREWTAEALDDIVKGLRDKGYEIADPHTIQLPE